MIVFKEIVIEGFRSIKHLNFKFSEKGVTFIKGRNGVGKSTLFEALYFALYGEAIKNSSISDLQTLPKYRDEDFKGTAVTLLFTINSKEIAITRNINYGKPANSDTYIYIDNAMVPIENKSDAQAKITALIGVSKELFQQSIFFAQKSLRLVDKKDADRRDILDQLFDIDVDKHMEKAKDETLAKQQEILTIQNQITLLENNINEYKTQIYNTENYILTFDLNKQTELAAAQVQLNDKKAQIAQLPPDDAIELVAPEVPDTKELNLVTSQYTEYNNKKIQLNHEKNGFRPISTTCDVCGSFISRDKIETLQTALDSKKLKTERELDFIEGELASLEIKIKAEQAKKDNYIVEYQEFTKLQMTNMAAINHRKNLIQGLEYEEKMYNVILEKTCPYTPEFVKDLKDKLLKAEQSLVLKSTAGEALEKEIKAYQYWATTGFGSKGLKAYIFQALLVRLNKSLMKYGQLLGLYVNMDVKMEGKMKSFTVTIAGEDGVEKNYSNLSGGEQKRVDVIVSFALHDIVPTKMSIMVLDEIFEGLDEQGLDIAMSLIRDKSKHQGVYLITHSINVDITNANVIELKKQNNFTSIN
jgi:DNA repair exonuclease SbcCD ATPase subunit